MAVTTRDTDALVGMAAEDVFVVRADGTGLRQITGDDHKDRFPQWAPDGQSIFFIADRGGVADVYRWALDGTVRQVKILSWPTAVSISFMLATFGIFPVQKISAEFWSLHSIRTVRPGFLRAMDGRSSRKMKGPRSCRD